jgi:tripartite-type tricarboxylate transporter receptor subunit TctC
MKFKTLIRSIGLGATLLVTTFVLPQASANSWKPSGPIMLQIGAGAGGETDALGRTFAKVLEEQTGWSVVSQNKPGGAGIAMLSSMKNRRPDGKTIGLAINMPVLVNLVLRGEKLPFNLDTFDYLGTISSAVLDVVARTDAPFNTIEELVAYSKSHGGVVISTDAKPQELIMKNIAKKTGAKFRILVTKSSGEQLQFLLGGKAMVGLTNGKHIPYLKTGELKMLASANSSRHDYAPEAKTLIEQGYNLFVDPTFYFVAPKGLDAQAKLALVEAISKAVESDEVKTIVKNVLASKTKNLGPEGTRKMLDEGLDGVKVLFK